MYATRSGLIQVGGYSLPRVRKPWAGIRNPVGIDLSWSSTLLVFDTQGLNGGPGAPGYMAPLGRRLAEASFRVLEPFQRRSGGEPLSVHRHVSDLAKFLTAEAPGSVPAIVGHSWGAMLALCFGCQFPELASPLVLVGCGTFDETTRAEYKVRVATRTHGNIESKLERISTGVEDPDERLRCIGDLLLPVYSHTPTVRTLEGIRCDAAGHLESWKDMLRLQAEGTLPARFSAIRSPVLMLHGADDPHPGPMIFTSLDPHLRHLEYREIESCGHYPWLESKAGPEFGESLVSWLRGELA